MTVSVELCADVRLCCRLQDLNLSQFDSGMSVITKDVEAEFSIPIHQLVQPARTLGRNGYMFLNNNIDTAMISIYQTRAEIADDIVLGLPFLSSNYMFVNNENQTFSLAPVKRRVSSGSTDIIPVLPSVDCGKTDLPTETGSSDPSTQTGIPRISTLLDLLILKTALVR